MPNLQPSNCASGNVDVTCRVRHLLFDVAEAQISILRDKRDAEVPGQKAAVIHVQSVPTVALMTRSRSQGRGVVDAERGYVDGQVRARRGPCPARFSAT
jgi:exosome complex RNA-binding protein Csl4